MSLEKYQFYWFWNRFTLLPDRLFVTDIYDDKFEFKYNERRYVATLAYADGKLFPSKESLPDYGIALKKAQARGAIEAAEDDNGWFSSRTYIQRWVDYREQE